MAFDVINATSPSKIITECHSADHYKHRNIYSKTEQLLMVFYSLRALGHLEADVEMSLTPCHAIVINTCALAYRCRNPNCMLYKKFREETDFLSPSTSLGQETKFSLKSYMHRKTEDPSYIYLAVEANTCVVLQLEQRLFNKIGSENLVCRTDEIMHSFVTKPGTRISYQVEGYFDSMYNSSFAFSSKLFLVSQ